MGLVVSRAIVYSHRSLETSRKILEENVSGIAPEEMLQHVIEFATHLERDDYVKDEQNQNNSAQSDKTIHPSNDSPSHNMHLSCRLQERYACSKALCLSSKRGKFL